MYTYTYAELLEKIEAIGRDYKHYKDTLSKMYPDIALIIEQALNEQDSDVLSD